MKKKIKWFTPHEWLVVALTLCAIVLIATGLLFPPPGEIHNSVLIAVGELFGFAALFTAVIAIENGTGVEVKHGNTTIKAEPKDDDDNDE